MPKFSIIVPVYNVADYLKKCLDSIVNQTYKDYEVIVVNDGSNDNSLQIIKEYPFTIINQKNQGLSSARNNGAKKARGEYLIFLDSDDYWNKDLLKEINKSLKNNPDIVRFQIQEVYENSSNIIQYKEIPFEEKDGKKAFELISKYHFVENAWCYAIKRDYYNKQKFKFSPGKIHEDFGLIPLVIIKADKVNSIDYIGYNYLQRTGSIMNSLNYEKTKKKVSDMYELYQNLIQEINKTNLNSQVFKSFISNSLILKVCQLEKKDYKKYKKRLKKDKVYDNLLTNSFTRKIKIILLKIDPKFYYKILRK